MTIALAVEPGNSLKNAYEVACRRIQDIYANLANPTSSLSMKQPVRKSDLASSIPAADLEDVEYRKLVGQAKEYMLKGDILSDSTVEIFQKKLLRLSVVFISGPKDPEPLTLSLSLEFWNFFISGSFAGEACQV